MRYFYAGAFRLLGVAIILTGAAAWAGIDHTTGMGGAINFAVGVLLIALGTLIFMVEGDQ